jgi:hypothetical protein
MQGILFYCYQCVLFPVFFPTEYTFNSLLQVIAADATNVMSSCYGSHVLRTLLCLCKGVPLDSLQNFHTTKRSAVLAERLSSGSNQSCAHDPQKFENGFLHVFKSFVSQMLHSAKSDIQTLCADKNSSLVLQVSIIFLYSTSIILSIIYLCSTCTIFNAVLNFSYWAFMFTFSLADCIEIIIW